MFDQVQPITSRAGSLIVWRSEQPHCNYPNDSQQFRINQYVKMFPAQENGKGIKLRQEMMDTILPTNFTLSGQDLKLLGKKKWK